MQIAAGFESLSTAWEQAMVNSDVQWPGRLGAGRAKAGAWEWLSQQQILVAWGTWISVCCYLNRHEQLRLLHDLRQEGTIEDFSPGELSSSHNEDGKCMETIPRHQQKKTHTYCTRCSTWLFISFYHIQSLQQPCMILLFPFYRWEAQKG